MSDRVSVDRQGPPEPAPFIARLAPGLDVVVDAPGGCVCLRLPNYRTGVTERQVTITDVGALVTALRDAQAYVAATS